MTAKLLSFTQQRGGWGNVELAQFARIQRLLENVGLQIDVEHGTTDEGDPWCVFCSSSTGEVVIHAARIDGHYMFDAPVLQQPIEGRSFQHCAEKFLDEAMQAIPVVRRRTTLQVHPSALLASVFLTIVLHAQATSEQNFFRGEGQGMLAELEGDGKHASGWFKLIAQHLAEMFGPQDNASGFHQNQQVQAWTAIIPAGLTVAVLGIVHELVTRDDRLLLAFDNAVIVASADSAESDVLSVTGAPEAAAEPNGLAVQDATVQTIAAAEETANDAEEAPQAEMVAAAAAENAPGVLEQDLPAAYLALADSFAEQVVTFLADAASTLALAAVAEAVEQPEEASGGSVDLAQAETPVVVNSIAAATLALLKPLIESDTIEFIAMPATPDFAVLLASSNGDGVISVDLDGALGDGPAVSGPALGATPPPVILTDTPPAPAVDVIEQITWLLEIADKTWNSRTASGDIVVWDKDATYLDSSERYVKTFVMDDLSEFTFIGVAADFEGLLV